MVLGASELPVKLDGRHGGGGGVVGIGVSNHCSLYSCICKAF